METHATGHPAKRERSSGHEPPDAASKRQKAQSHPLQPAATAHASQPLPSQQEEAELDQDPIIHIFNPFNYPRKRASIACEICRVRKTRCDAARPRCSSCAQLGVACTYRKLAIGVRPEQTATENFLSSIASRLDRIEALILDQNGRPGPATNYSYAASSPSIQAATGSGSNSYPTPSSPVIIPAPAVPPTATEATRIRRMGLSMYAMSQLNGHEAPPSLKILQYEESEPFLEWEMERGKRLYQARSHDDLDFSLSVCWRLQQSFSERILSWFPLFNLDRCVEVVNKLHEPRLGSSDIDKCLALFILALGALSKANHITSDKPAALSGLDYFCAASDILDLDKDSRYTIIEAQCHLLKALYLLLCLRPLQASDAVFSAARSILAVFDLPSRLAKDPLLKESCHRTFWTCFLLEHELKPLISYNPQLLQLVNESVPLPLSHDHEQSIYWFLAEIALRRIFSHCIEDVRVESHLMYNPKVTKVLAEQLYEWYKGLPTRLQFEFDTKPLLDHQKAFLRGQYYVLLLIIYWPSVVRLLTKELDSEISEKQREELYTDALKAINYGVAYVFATESLLLERHQMVFGNVMGTFFTTMILLTAYGTQDLRPIIESFQEPSVSDAIRKGYDLLSIWAEVPYIQRDVDRVKGHMIRLGLLPAEEPALATAADAAKTSLRADAAQSGIVPEIPMEGAIPAAAAAPVSASYYGMRTVDSNPMSVTRLLGADGVPVSRQLAARPREL